MRLTLMTLAAVLVVGTVAGGQQRYLPRAQIQRRNGVVTVSADDPRPLWQAISALRKEYGWVVDYEEPLWPSTELRDTSPAAWHAAHPGRTGWLVPTGGAFQCSYRAAPDMWNSASEEPQILDNIVTEYDVSENPGKFIVRAQQDGSYAVIAISASPPLLDTRISLPTAARSAESALDLILDALSTASGADVRLAGMPPVNLLHQSTVTVGGSDVPTRSLLIGLFQAMHLRVSWDLWYEPNLREWGFILRPAARAVPGMFGSR